MRELWQWVKGVFRHWIGSVGCAAIATFQLVYSIWQQSWPPMITWLILLVCLFAAAFLAWRDEHRKAGKLQSEIDAYTDSARIRRDEQSKRVWNKASELLKRQEPRLEPFQALYAAGAADLETNDQLVWAANKLSEHHKHPLTWLERCAPENEWLSFLQWGKHHPDFEFDRGDDYLEASIEWAVRGNRGTRDEIAAEILRGMIDRGDAR